MTRGNTLLLIGVSLIVGGCVTDGKLQVRAIQPAGSRYSGNLLDRARAELAYGSVGLALEDLRTLQREQGESGDVFSGIAACYAAMGRYDLARTNYELALAYSPNEPRLLLALAATLERIGEGEQAAQVRAEAARLAAAPALKAPVQQAAVTPVGVPQASSITVKLPPPHELQQPAASPQIAASGRIPTAVRMVNARLPILNKPNLSAIAASLPSLEIPTRSRKEEQRQGPEAPALPPPELAVVPVRKLGDLPVTIGVGLSVQPRVSVPHLSSIALQEPLRPLPKEHRDTSLLTADNRAPPPAPAPTPTPIRVEIALSEKSSAKGPHLERASLGEVQLVTMRGPAPLTRAPTRAVDTHPLVQLALAMNDGPRPLADPKPALRPTALQWVPLRYSAGGQNVQLLNAARTDRLAARTRQALLDRGWRKIGIGNARQVLQHSLVLYAPERAPLGLRMAAHFGCKAVQAPVRSVVVLLGRDAAARRSSSART